MTQSSAVVFDLGNVLLNFSLEPLARFIEAHGLAFDEAKDLYENIGGLQYEHGRISSAEFLNGIQNQLPKQVTTEEIAKAWCNIFVANEPMLNILEQCRKQTRVYILSNSNELHWNYVCGKFSIDKIVDDLITSHEIGYMKPAPEIYTEAQRRFSLLPSETVFIDDRLENVVGAQSAGWNAIYHQDVEITRSQLSNFGLEL
jgi:putative hydrolase of the HAD superfamily